MGIEKEGFANTVKNTANAKMSVIVPIYNVEQYLRRCLDSLVNQTLTDIEIILVDDGSPDNCPAICDEYAGRDARIKVIHKENAGVGAARNDGLDIAKGEYVIFCDSDDWMEPDALETLYKAAKEKNADVVVADINLIKGEKTVYNQYFSQEFVYSKRKDMDKLVAADIYLTYSPLLPLTPTIGLGGPWNKAVRREFLLAKGIKFDTNLLGVFDDILYTAYLYAEMKSIVYLQKPVYNYVTNPTSITRSFKANSVEISKRIFQAFQKFIDIKAPDGKWNKAFYALIIRRFEEDLRLYFFSRKNSKTRDDILRELKALMHSEPYVQAIKNVNLKKLRGYHLRVALLMKADSAFGLWVFYKLKMLLGRI